MLNFFSKKRVYLDYAAHTPLAPEAREAMRLFSDRSAGNPSAIHKEGLFARMTLTNAKAVLAKMINAHQDELVLTSGGTEGNNLALFGSVRSPRALASGKHIVTTSFEHRSVLRVVQELLREGWEVTYVDPESDGTMDPKKIADAIRPDTVLISMIAAHNELGTLQPVREVAKQIRKKREGRAYPLFHIDACQWIGTLPFDTAVMGADLVSFNAHKMYGPSGVGALYIKRGVELAPLLYGGGQEGGMRPGTENVEAAVGFAAAAEVYMREGSTSAERISLLREYTKNEIEKRIERIEIQGTANEKIPGVLNISFEGVESEQLVIELDEKGFALSSGAACATNDLESGYAILALGKSEQTAKGALRISIGRTTTQHEIDLFIKSLVSSVQKLRRFSLIT